jgi:hypothetical protein
VKKDSDSDNTSIEESLRDENTVKSVDIDNGSYGNEPDVVEKEFMVNYYFLKPR